MGICEIIQLHTCVNLGLDIVWHKTRVGLLSVTIGDGDDIESSRLADLLEALEQINCYFQAREFLQGYLSMCSVSCRAMSRP